MTTLTGGHFQNFLAQPLANGYLLLQLSHDAQATGSVQVVAGPNIRVPLDANGSVSGVINVWANGDLTPTTTFYFVQVFAADGTVQSSPQLLKLTIPSGATYNLDNWIPLSP